ncbi:MAG: DUF4831 family protein [Bacteroidales bacterium]|nr:DUF4831 family protein [Bacteroidales bacterium]
MNHSMIYRRAVLLIGLCISVFVQGQISVYHIDPSSVPLTQQGIFYSLPRTVVNIEVVIDRVEKYKGPYSDYALRYLGLQNVVMANSVEYRISRINITTSAEPDPDQYYFVQIGDKLSKTEKAGFLALNESGLILGTLPGAQDSVEQIVRIIQDKDAVTLSEKDVFPEIFKYYADISVFEKVDTIIRRVSIDTLTLERQYLKRTMVEKSPEQKAKEAADFISKIKENRFNLLTGYQEVSYNRETLEYMDTQLNLLEKEYMKLFTGISIQKRYTYEYKYIPLPNQINTEIPVFKFLSNKGVMDLDVMGGRVITINIQRVGNTNQVASYLRRAEEEAKIHGFYYRIPELARISVRQPDGATEETQCLINQLGVVSYLPASQWKVNFHEKTGGIKEVAID